MAQLKDSVVSGSLRVTDTLYATTEQFKILKIPTSSNGTAYGPGTSGQVLKTNGTSVYWDAVGGGTVTSVQVQASSPLTSSTSTAQTSSLNTTISFSNQSPNTVLSGPSSGSGAGAPTFRSLVAADIPDLAWSKITSGKPTTLSGYGITDAAASDHTQAVNKGGTNITSYTIGDILYASAATTLSKLAGNTTTTTKYLKSVATTSGTAVAPVWAQIAASEISGLGTMATANTGDYATSGHTQAVNKGGTNITSYTIGDILYASAQTTLSKLAGNTTTTAKFLKSVATTSGTAVAPSWSTLAASDIPDLNWSKITAGKPTTLSGYGITDAAASDHTQAVNKGGTNITSYTIGDILYASGSTALSKLSGNTTTTVKYLKSVATTSGTAVAPVWAQIASSEVSGLGAAAAKGVTDNSSNADVASTDTNLITGRTLYYQLAKKGYTTNTGTVTSVTLTQGAGITVSDSGTAITGSGSRTISITGMNTSSGSTSKCLTEKGTWASFTNNAGTVTSVQVQASGPLSSSTSTAQSSTLSTTISFSNQDPNKILAGPSSGSSAGAPSFRALVAADIPGLPWSKITSGTPTTVAGYGITDAVSTSALSDYVAKAGDTMTGSLKATGFNVYASDYPMYTFTSASTDTSAFGAVILDVTNRRMWLRQRNANTYVEDYKLPTNTVTDAHATYDLLTSKNAVTVAQGGTGATTASDARTNLGAMAATPPCIELMPGSSSAGHGGYIDFHYNNSSADYTSRILETNGQLEFVVSNGAKFTTTKGSADGSTLAASLVLAETSATIANGSYLYGNAVYAPNMAAGAFAIGVIVGQSASAGNCGYLAFKYAGNNNAGNFVSLGLHSTDHALKVWKSGDVETTGDLYVNGGDVIIKSNYYPFVSFRNSSNQEFAGVWGDTSNKRIYLREHPSAGSSNYTDIVFPTAKSSGSENVFVYTSRNFSLSGTTLTITPPS